MTWFYEQNGEPTGPVSEERLQELADVGEITEDTLVWCEELEDWVTFAEACDLEWGDDGAIRNASQTDLEATNNTDEADTQPEHDDEGSPTVWIAVAAVVVLALGASFFLKGSQESSPSEGVAEAAAVAELLDNKKAGVARAAVAVKARDDLGSLKRRAAMQAAKAEMAKARAELAAAAAVEVAAPAAAAVEVAAPAAAAVKVAAPAGADMRRGRLAGATCKYSFQCKSKQCVNGACSDGRSGSPCKYGFQCKSKQCVNGACSDGRSGSPCKYSFQCKSRKCSSGVCR